MVACAAVALLAEGVDRNIRTTAGFKKGNTVALLAEGVDRNLILTLEAEAAAVALLAEGVDRNTPMDSRTSKIC